MVQWPIITGETGLIDQGNPEQTDHPIPDEIDHPSSDVLAGFFE
jgi:hypothetical protein